MMFRQSSLNGPPPPPSNYAIFPNQPYQMPKVISPYITSSTLHIFPFGKVQNQLISTDWQLETSIFMLTIESICPRNTVYG